MDDHLVRPLGHVGTTSPELTLAAPLWLQKFWVHWVRWVLNKYLLDLRWMDGYIDKGLIMDGWVNIWMIFNFFYILTFYIYIYFIFLNIFKFH